MRAGGIGRVEAVAMKYSGHALWRMTVRSITVEDVEAVLARPRKVAQGEGNCLNYWGYGPSGYRLRVTVCGGTVISTVTWADSRKEQR